MNPIGKIKGGRALGQVFYLPFRGKHKNLVDKYIGFNRFQKLLSPAELTVPLNQLAQPTYPLLIADILLFPLFITPVSRYPVFRNMVHLMSANLYLQRGGAIHHHRM